MRELDITNSRFPIKDVADCARRYSKAPGNHVSFHDPFKGTNLCNLSMGETAITDIPAFSYHVPNVVCVGAEPKMVWANTGGRVTSGAIVEYVSVIGDRPEVDHPRNSMGQFVSSAILADSPITLGQLSAPKQPTTITLNNSTPESRDNGWRKTLSEQIREITVSSHTTILSVELVCRSLARKSARTFSFLPKTS